MTIQQPTELTHAAMLGLGVYRPERVVTNDEICEVLDSSDEWIQSRSGIRTRRFAGPDETLIGMATAAAERALAVSGVTADQLGCVIVATSTHPEHTPGVGPAGRHPAGVDHGGVRRLRRVRGLLPRAQPGVLDDPLRRRRSTCWSSGSSS